MENQNPSDPTNNNPQGESFIMKTAWQVLEELAGSGDDSDGGNRGVGDGAPVAVAVGVGDDNNGCDGGVDGGAPVMAGGDYGGDNSDGIGGSAPMAVAVAVGDGGGNGNGGDGDTSGSISGGAPVAVAVAVGGGGGGDSGGNIGGGGSVAVAVAVGSGSTVVEGVVVNEGMQGKKRKTSIVRDPPTGKPTCPLCEKEFPTWKGAFGHMRAHPDRDYRGFFKPPVFGSPSSTQDQPPSDDKGDDNAKKSAAEDNSGEKGSASSPAARVLMFDLNEPIEEEGSSHAAEPAEENVAVEGKLGFDLNEMPSAED